MLDVSRLTTVGEIDWPSISSLAGSATLVTASVPEPEVGQPSFVVGGGAAAAFTTALGTDVALADPSLFFAVTRTRIVLPASTPFSVYVLSVPFSDFACLSALVTWMVIVPL